MPTDKPRFSITVDQNLSDAIDDYKYRTRAKNQTQAVVELIERGLDSLDLRLVETKKSPAPEGTEDEEKVQMVVQGLTHLLVEAGWIAPGADLSDAQLRTLVSYVVGMNAYFNGEF